MIGDGLPPALLALCEAYRAAVSSCHTAGDDSSADPRKLELLELAARQALGTLVAAPAPPAHNLQGLALPPGVHLANGHLEIELDVEINIFHGHVDVNLSVAGGAASSCAGVLNTPLTVPVPAGRFERVRLVL